MELYREQGVYHVTCTPHTFTHFVTDDDLFYVIACNGVWDVLEPQEVVEIIYRIPEVPQLTVTWQTRNV